MQRTLARENLSRTAPSRDVGGRVPEQDQQARVARGFFERYVGDFAPEEIEASQFTSIADFRRARERAKGRARR